MNKTIVCKRAFSLFLVLVCCVTMLTITASAQGGTFEYDVTATITNNDLGGVKDGVTYLGKGAVVTLRFSLPANSNVASGEVHIEYDPAKYTANVEPSTVTIANMSANSIFDNPARTYASIDDTEITDNMSSTSNYICQFFFSTDDATGDMGGGIICDVTFTVDTETAGLTPATALDSGIRIVSAMANEDNGTLIGTDISKDGTDFIINSTISGYKLAEVPKIRLLMFDYDVNGKINSVDLAVFVKLLTGATPITPELLRISDINGDGRINSIDYAAIRACLTKGEPSFVYINVVE